MTRDDEAWTYIVLPELKRLLGCSQWVSTEHNTRDLRQHLSRSGVGNPALYDLLRVAELLDTRYAIDGFLTGKSGPIAVAKRQQFKSTTLGWGYRTVTIRSELISGSRTERHKLLAQSSVSPQLHVQAYINDTTTPWQLDCLIAAETRTVMLAGEGDSRVNGQDGNVFTAHHVAELRDTAEGHDHMPVVFVDRYDL